MGYEGHLMIVRRPRGAQAKRVDEAWRCCARAHADVGGDVISAGGTGTYDLNRVATEIQAGSYALMDTAYAKLGLPFRLALSVLATVISVSPAYAVADCGLKALGMDHGNPDRSRARRSGSAPTSTSPSRPSGRVRVGERVRVWPAHVDPTDRVPRAPPRRATATRWSTSWPVDLRGW